MTLLFALKKQVIIASWAHFKFIDKIIIIIMKWREGNWVLFCNLQSISSAIPLDKSAIIYCQACLLVFFLCIFLSSETFSVCRGHFFKTWFVASNADCSLRTSWSLLGLHSPMFFSLVKIEVLIEKLSFLVKKMPF